MRLPRTLRSALRGDRGVVAPMTALTMAVLLGMVGLVTDVSVWFAQRRDLQAATDAAALGSARFANDGPATVRTRAEAILTANGVDPDDLDTVETGFYCPSEDVTVDPFQSTRCADDPPNSPINSVRLTANGRASIIFSRLFTDADISDRPIGVTSTAALINEAGIRAGTGVAALDAGIFNAVLSSLTGGTVSLDAVSYRGLLNTNVDGVSLLNAIAAEAGVTAGTYGELLQTSVTSSQLLNAAIDVLAEQNQVGDAALALAGLQALEASISGNGSVALGDLFELGVWDELPIGSDEDAPTALHAGVNAYQLATLGLQLANGRHAVSVPTSGLNIPGLLTAQLSSSIIERPAEPYFGFGPKGTTVRTAQVRAKLELNAVGGVIRLPLYIEAASGRAWIEEISCSTDPENVTVQVNGTSGIAHVYLGQITETAPIPSSSGLTVTPVPLITLPVLGGVEVRAKASLPVGSTAPLKSALFKPPGKGGDGTIGQPETDTTSAVDPIPYRYTATSLPSSLAFGISDININVCASILGGCILPGSVSSLLKLVLDPVLSPVLSLVFGILTSPGLNSLLDNLLRALGVYPGYMDVFVTGARCGVPVLIE